MQSPKFFLALFSLSFVFHVAKGQCVLTTPCGIFTYEQSMIRTSSNQINGVTTITVRNDEGVQIDLIDCEESGAVSTSCTSLLPVELISFSAVIIENANISIDWQTGSEINNDYFEILHSNDGVNFKVVGEVQGAGNTNKMQNYSFVHNQPKDGINYYQLRQVDFGGESEYSEVRVVELEHQDANLKIFPNPATDYIHMHFSQDRKVSSLLVFDNLGRLVLKQGLIEGSRFSSLDISELKSGIYWIKLDSDTQSQSAKFVKL